MSEIIRLGVIGLGRMGRAHIDVLLRITYGSGRFTGKNCCCL